MKDEVKACTDAPTAAGARRHLGNALGAMLTGGHANDWIAEPREFFPRQPRTAKRDKGRQHGESVQFIPPRMRRPLQRVRRSLRPAWRAARSTGRRGGLLVAAASSVGLRQGELFAAVTDALRPAAGEWFIDRQVVRPKGQSRPTTRRVIHAAGALTGATDRHRPRLR